MLDDAEMTPILRAEMNRTFVEDQEIVEAVQRNLDSDLEAIPSLNIAADTIALRARRVPAALIGAASERKGERVA